MHESSAFVTLTFADESLPSDLSVNVRDLQLFMKRLRKQFGRVRFFACGEYGDEGGRPHYHVILFGVDFASDRTLWRFSATGHQIYRSRSLELLWPFGHCELGSVTPEAGAYVARYCLKKLSGEVGREQYVRSNVETGETWSVRPEFAVMSNRPGIGASWFERFRSDAFPSDFLVIRGRRVPVPRYYSKKLTEEEKLRVLVGRKKGARKHVANNTPERLAVREELQTLRARRLVRPLESKT